MNNALRIIADKKYIYITFLSFHFIGLIWFIFTGKSVDFESVSYQKLLAVKLIAFGIYLLLSYLSFRDIKAATWIFAFIILLSGAGSAAIGTFKIGWHQFMLKPYFILLGLYFIFGSVYLICQSSINRKKF